MAKTAVKKQFYWARDIDERTLRKIEILLRSVGEVDYKIRAEFDNGFDVECSSVDELVAIPALDVRRITRLWVYATEDISVALAQNRPHTRVSIWVNNEYFYASIRYEVEGEYEKCVGLQLRLDEIMRSTLSIARSLLHPRYFVDVAVVFIFGSTFIVLFVLRPLGFAIATEPMKTLVQVGTLVVYGALKTLVFPRLKLKIGHGASTDAKRSALLKILIGILVVGAITAIFQAEVVRFWEAKRALWFR